MEPPRLKRIVTDGVEKYRVCYLGMTRDFTKDYAALSFYEHLCQCYVGYLPCGHLLPADSRPSALLR
jgi:hypothetical protein